MAGKEVREYTNLSDPKDRKWGKGKDKIDDEDITFQRMVAKMQEVAGERGGYLHGRGGTCLFFLPRIVCLHDIVNFALDCSQLWTVMTCYILRNKWKLRKMLSAFCGALKNGHLLHLRYPNSVEVYIDIGTTVSALVSFFSFFDFHDCNNTKLQV
ncbi:hypothetical protein Cni_G18584 [Canna indica]|uniref:Uncharacterized protein n=1 Tax=Canna indica TaxID=4628 RepID=A0AAQ3QEH2_9LILI|nr:hypothetical protein Cni_G18584 [Canna indica]